MESSWALGQACSDPCLSEPGELGGRKLDRPTLAPLPPRPWTLSPRHRDTSVSSLCGRARPHHFPPWHSWPLLQSGGPGPLCSPVRAPPLHTALRCGAASVPSHPACPWVTSHPPTTPKTGALHTHWCHVPRSTDRKKYFKNCVWALGLGLGGGALGRHWVWSSAPHRNKHLKGLCPSTTKDISKNPSVLSMHRFPCNYSLNNAG